MIAMTINEPQESQESPDDLLTAGEAAAYLAKRWGRAKYSTSAFKQLRHRKKLQPAIYIEANSTLWRRGDLDQIPEPSRSNPRPSRRKKQSLDNDK